MTTTARRSALARNVRDRELRAVATPLDRVCRPTRTMNVSGDPVTLLLNGLAGVILSLITWRLTGNWWAWFVLFMPGAVLILLGLWALRKE
jgi:hypothetical protein